MTLTKELLQKARVDYERIQTVTTFYDFEDLRVDNVHRMAAAARFVERLLPEIKPLTITREDGEDHTFEQLWDEGLVRVVAEAMKQVDTNTAYDEKLFWETLARAVLAALVGEVEK